MKMCAVESSNVAAIGYDSDVRTLAVRFKSGALYIWPNVTPEQHQEFSAAPSKGAWLSAFKRNHDGMEVVHHGPPDDKAATDMTVVNESKIIGLANGADQGPAPLQTVEPDVCCNPGLYRALANSAAGGLWTCEKCGTEWERRAAGSVVHWAPRVPVLVWR